MQHLHSINHNGYDLTFFRNLTKFNLLQQNIKVELCQDDDNADCEMTFKTFCLGVAVYVVVKVNI